MKIRARRRISELLVAVLLVFLLPGTSRAEDDPSDSSQSKDASAQTPKTLTGLGIQFEFASALTGVARKGAINSLEQPLQSVLQSDLDDAEKAAATFLFAEMEGELNRPAKARELFEKAAKEDKKGPFVDDAEFAAIRALEAEGQNEEALKQWKKWEEEHPHSPLLAQAWIARAWNELRQSKWDKAEKTLNQLKSIAPWTSGMQRVVVAHATIEYAQGDPAACLSELANAPAHSAAVSYLNALCYDEQAEVLHAAAAYQEVYERYPDSPLRYLGLYAKANSFLNGKAYRSAAEGFATVAKESKNPELQAEALLRQGAALFAEGSLEEATPVLKGLVSRFPKADAAARGQFLLGEISVAQDDPQGAIVQYNLVLRNYFEHQVAASAQYRIGRCYETLGRRAEAVGAYETVVRGYPLEAEAPPAAYLAGVGLLEMDRPLAAAPYFQLVLDRYAGQKGSGGFLIFKDDKQKEVVEAALCLLLLSYHQAGDLGQLSGAPHLMLQAMPPSQTSWRGYALLIDADALASQGRYQDAQASLQKLLGVFKEHDIALPATQLLAWTFAQQGMDDLAIATEKKMLQRFSPDESSDSVRSAYLRMAHVHFNQKHYEKAAEIYEDYRHRFGDSPQFALATYQAGVCYQRLGRSGDAVDRWEELVAREPSAPIAEKAWARAGDLYFQSGHYEDAKRCYQGLLENFESSSAGATGLLRMAQCDFNAGRDADALQGYSTVIAQYPHTMSAKEAKRGMELALYRLGQEDSGSEVLSELIEKYPESSFAADAQFQIASGLYKKEQYAEAAEAFRRVVSRFPSYDEVDRAQFLSGEAWAKANETERSIQAYQQFLLFFPESELRPTVQFRLGLQLFQKKDYMEAAVKFTAVVDQSDDKELQRAGLFNLAMAQQLLGQLADAKTSLQRYRSLYPQDERSVEVSLQLGKIDESQGEWDAAAGEYESAVNAGVSKDAICEVLYRLGQCREKLTETDKALAAYRRSMKSGDAKDSYRLSAIARCAAIYEDREDYTNAVAAYRDLIQNADDPELVAVAQNRVKELKSVIH